MGIEETDQNIDSIESLDRFYEDLSSGKVLPFTVEEAREFSEVLLTWASDYIDPEEARSTIRSSGPCFSCHKHIPYGKPSRWHNKSGDLWLNKALDLCKTKKPFYNKYGEVYVGKYRPSAIKSYLCESCLLWLENAEKSVRDERKARNQERLEQFNIEYTKKQTSLTEWACGEYAHGDYIPNERAGFILYGTISVQLSSMPYWQFLKTRYWHIVRKSVLKRDKYRCSVCRVSGIIDVHHTTYDHHGQEHLYLEDLIVLCRDCHGKFHNKLGANSA